MNKLDINIPNNLSISQIDKHHINITGLLGSIKLNLQKIDPHNLTNIQYNTHTIQLHLNTQNTLYTHNIARLIKQSIDGVTRGHSVYLNILGVGYRAENIDGFIKFKLGQSHDLHFNLQDDVKVFCVKPTLLCVYGIDKHKVTQTAASIKSLKPVEVYKGKGIRYLDEVVVLKEGKKK